MVIKAYMKHMSQNISSFNSKPIELKELDFEFSDYSGNAINRLCKVPTNVKWVKYNGLLHSKKISHVYYWTIINKNFHNLKACVEMQEQNRMYSDYYVFNNLILITMQSCKPINEFELCSHQEMIDAYGLSKFVFVDLSPKNGNVIGMYKIRKAEHPDSCELSYWGISNPILGEAISSFKILYSVKFLNICAGAEINSNIMSIVGDPYNAHFIIGQANSRLFNSQEYSIEKAESKTSIQWRIENYDKMFKNLEITNKTAVEQIYSVWKNSLI